MPFREAAGYKAQGVDPRLIDILQQAAAGMPGYSVEATSGLREGDPRFHGQGLATDVRLIGPDGKPVPNYQSAEGYNAYQQLAQKARLIQMQKYPQLANAFRWGGYFWNGGPGNYGNADLMHFDLGGDRVGMAGGSWAAGPSDRMRAAYHLAPGGGMAGTTQNAPMPSGAQTAGTVPETPAANPATTAAVMAAAADTSPVLPAPPQTDYSALTAGGGIARGNAQQVGLNQQSLDIESSQDRQNQANLLGGMGSANPASPTAQELSARYDREKASGGPLGDGSPLTDVFKLRDIGQARQLKRPITSLAGLQSAPTSFASQPPLG